MYLINNPLKNIKTITLLLICFLTFNVFANEADELLSITKSAEQGDAPAQYNMGVSYFFGNGVSQDYKKAIDWFLKATEQNNAEAEAFLGEMYDTGQGVVKNDKKAAKWHLKAAEHGNAASQNMTGDIYSMADDFQQAARWYLKAAEQGNTKAQYSLGELYRYGLGVIQSNKQYYIWSSIAAANGDEYRSRFALRNRDQAAKFLSPRGLEEAQEEAVKLNAKIYNKYKHKSKLWELERKAGMHPSLSKELPY